MKKNIITLLFALLFSLSCFSQVHLKIFYKNGKEKVEPFKRVKNNTISIRFNLKKVIKFEVYNGDETTTYYIVNTKNSLNSKRSIRGFGIKAFEGKNVDLFYVSFYSRKIHLNPPFIPANPRHEAFALRHNEKYAYNIRFIDGFGWGGIDSRLKTFFKDCPKLIKKIKNKTIDKKDSRRIVEFYDKECGS